MTVGVEEELMLLDPASLDLTPRAHEVVAAAAADPRFKLELPAAQVEIVLPPVARVGDAVAALGRARRDLVDIAATVDAERGGLRLAGAGAHAFAAAEGELNTGGRYDRTRAEFGRIANRQLVFALQVHVCVRGAGRPLAVHDALRSYLPELTALAANSPFHAGEDTGLQTIRPKLCEQLPRQGVPPALRTWERYADALAWVDDPGTWWWELRPHPEHGTLEVRVPDAQRTVGESAAVIAVVHALVAWLAERHDAGDLPEPAATWRIEENRWAAIRHGLDGELTDLETGERRPVRERLAALVDALGPVAARLGCAAELESARDLVAVNGAMRQRRVAAEAGLRALIAFLSNELLSGAGPEP